MQLARTALKERIEHLNRLMDENGKGSIESDADDSNGKARGNNSARGKLEDDKES